MSSVEFSYWKEFDRIEPFGHSIDHWHARMIAATTANASGRYDKTMHPSDFSPRHIA